MDTAVWATEADRFDAISAAHIEPLLAGAGVTGGASVVDVGCGAGATTCSAATAVGPDGLVLGVDVAGGLVAVARQRLAGFPQAEVIEADATTYDFAGLDADAVISRSTVMLFRDPAAGLLNLRRALRRGGRLACTVWQAGERNGWWSIPMQALGLPTDGPFVGPGAFALADPLRLRQQALIAGFRDVDVTPVEHGAKVGHDVDDAVAFFELVAGPAPPSLGEALRPYARRDGVIVPAAAWLLTATAP